MNVVALEIFKQVHNIALAFQVFEEEHGIKKYPACKKLSSYVTCGWYYTAKNDSLLAIAYFVDVCVVRKSSQIISWR